MTDSSAPFPESFVWGAATAAYQVEGSPLADGAGPSIWHRFTHTPGLTVDGATGDVACDHYRRYESDVDHMRRLGLRGYRFSVSWSRILPEGRGHVNPAGIAFYDRLVDALCASGILPCVTLYHWDLPAALDDRGGWLNPDIADWFAAYATVVARALGDRVGMWATLNEPWVVVDAGYVHGVHAPGHRNRFEAPLATHNLLRAHAAGVGALRAHVRAPVGIVVNIEPKDAATDAEADRVAADLADQYMNRQFLDPLFLGAYPEGMRVLFGDAWPDFARAEMDAIRTPLDFLGINYYTRGLTAAHPGGWPVPARTVPNDGAEYTDLMWEVHPESMTRVLCWVRDRYGDVPLYITENGSAFPDPESVPGPIHEDPRRVAYLRAHILAARAAMERGVDLRGYFAWSLLDNLEWSAGFSKRFGLIHVDFATQKRTWKRSAEVYREVIATGGASLL